MAFLEIADVLRVAGIPSAANGGPISDDDILAHIVFAEAEAEKHLATSLQPGGRSKTETLDGTGTDSLFLRFYPIRSITSLSIAGTSVTPSNVYVYGNTGQLRLKTSAEVTTFQRDYPQQVVITYVYGREPSDMERLFAATICATMVLIEQVGGTFDDITSYSIPEFTASKGEPWTQIRETLQRLSDRLDKMKLLLRPIPIIA